MIEKFQVSGKNFGSKIKIHYICTAKFKRKQIMDEGPCHRQKINVNYL
jgi:hypothetical protein